MIELAKNAQVIKGSGGYGHLKLQQLVHFIDQTNSNTFVSEQEEINLLLAKKFFRF
jgi:hypothetical protein